MGYTLSHARSTVKLVFFFSTPPTFATLDICMELNFMHHQSISKYSRVNWLHFPFRSSRIQLKYICNPIHSLVITSGLFHISQRVSYTINASIARTRYLPTHLCITQFNTNSQRLFLYEFVYNFEYFHYFFSFFVKIHIGTYAIYMALSNGLTH